MGKKIFYNFSCLSLALAVHSQNGCQIASCTFPLKMYNVKFFFSYNVLFHTNRIQNWDLRFVNCVSFYSYRGKFISLNLREKLSWRTSICGQMPKMVGLQREHVLWKCCGSFRLCVRKGLPGFTASGRNYSYSSRFCILRLRKATEDINLLSLTPRWAVKYNGACNGFWPILYPSIGNSITR